MNNKGLIGLNAKADYYDPETFEVFIIKGQAIDAASLDRLELLHLAQTELELHGEYVIPQLESRWTGCRRYKGAIARVLLKDGSGTIRVNGKDVWDYFSSTPKDAVEFLRRIWQFNETRSILDRIEGIVHVHGSNPRYKQQAHAVAHALAHALASNTPELKTKLKKMGYGGIKSGGLEEVNDM